MKVLNKCGLSNPPPFTAKSPHICMFHVSCPHQKIAIKAKARISPDFEKWKKKSNKFEFCCSKNLSQIVYS